MKGPINFTTITGSDWRAALIAARDRRAQAHERSLKNVIKCSSATDYKLAG
jgi:hypothetical protein